MRNGREFAPDSVAARSGLSRRNFVRLIAAGGVGLALGFDAKGNVVAALGAAPDDGFAPNQWLRIDQRGTVTIRAHKTEMGQGVRTSLPAIVAAELGADWSHVKVMHAEPGPDFQDMGTSGSSSVPESWTDLRQAGAVARTMLTLAAAARWRVSPEECRSNDGFIHHRASDRSLSFGALVSDAAKIPVPPKVLLRDESELTLIGSRLPRPDTPDMVSGRATYGTDVRIPGLRFAVIARPPVAGATPKKWNEAAARRTAGVHSVTQISGGIAVVANSTWSAIQGRMALAVEWEVPAMTEGDPASYCARLEKALPNGKLARRDGEPLGQGKAPARELDALYRAPFQAHAAMEPLSCVADVRADRCTVWVGTQRPNGVKQVAMEMLGLPRDSVTVHVTLLGGAFGRRIAIDYAREAVELSRAIAAPVQIMWTREDDIAHDMYQAAQVGRMTAGLDESGNIVSWRHQVAVYHLSMFGHYNPDYKPAEDNDPDGGYDTPYTFPSLEVTQAVLDSPVATGAWRSVDYPAAVFARECFLDEVAAATKRDPLALRLSLIASPGLYKTRSGARPNGDRLRNVLRLAAERAGWGAPMAPTKDGRRWGRGIACNPYHRGAMVAQVAEVSVGGEGDIRVHRVITAMDVGRVIDRSGLEAQIEGGVAWALTAALKTKITFAGGKAQQSNFHDFPVLRLREMPAQEFIIVDSTLGPFGAGEPPVPAVIAAVANAVFAATGQRLRELPLRLDADSVNGARQD